ncbi:MAG: hypothetical protein DRG59_11315 [Deltaproteobacteria bacterium]|nr:MAG: hypothetical protein DRG59_11315 [Deltaproteobacteria bacterium]
MVIDNLLYINAIVEVLRYKKIISMKDEYKTPFLDKLIYITESEKDLSEKKKGAVSVLDELADFLKLYKDMLPENISDSVDELMGCARNDIENNEYWAAISDIDIIEKYMIQPYLKEKLLEVQKLSDVKSSDIDPYIKRMEMVNNIIFV